MASPRAPSGAHEHLRAFIGNHHLTHRTFGFNTLQTVHRANFGSPPVRVTAIESLRTLTECFRTLTEPLRKLTDSSESTEHLRAFAGNHTTRTSETLLGSHRIRRTTCRVCESLGSPLVRDDSHRVSPDTHRNLRDPLDLSEIRCQLSKVPALRRQSRYKDHFARGILDRTVHLR
jgi:hypothetical protein